MDAQQCANYAAKFIMVSLLLYAAYTVAFCPCYQLLSCHLTPFYASLALVVLITFLFNGFRLRSYTS